MRKSATIDFFRVVRLCALSLLATAAVFMVASGLLFVASNALVGPLGTGSFLALLMLWPIAATTSLGLVLLIASSVAVRMVRAMRFESGQPA